MTTARGRRVGIAGCVLVAALVVTFAAAPWFRVSNHPVQLQLAAPANTRVEVCWAAPRQDCLPFLRKGGSASGGTWLAELPPRRTYDVRLYFPDGITDGELHRVSVLNTNQPDQPLAVFGYGRVLITFPPNGSLPLGEINGAGLATLTASALIVFAVTAGLLGGACLLISALLAAEEWSPPSGVEARSFPWLTFLLASCVHILLVFNSAALMSADSEIYMRLGYTLATQGRYGIPGSDPWNQTVRTPGYPAFLALLFAYLGGTHLSVTTLIQASSRMIAVGLLAWSLRRWVPPWAMRLTMIWGALDPAGYFMSRSVSSDGLATTFVLIAAAAYFESLGLTQRPRKWVLAGFGCAAACAGLVRPPAAVVLILPLLEAVHRLLTVRRETWSTGLRRCGSALGILALCVAPVIAAFSSWAFFNKARFNYLGISSYAETVRFAALMETGTFDARALEKQGLYASYLMGREATNYWQYHVQITGPISTYAITDRSRYVDQLNKGVAEVVDASERLTPTGLKIARQIRNLWWGIAFPDEKTYGGFPLRIWRIQFESGYGSKSLVQDLPGSIAAEMPNVVLDARGRSNLVSAYTSVASHYDALGMWLFAVGAVAAVASLYLYGPAAASPFIVYSANLLAYAWIGLVVSRYIQSYDFLLVIQIIVGASLLWKRRLWDMPPPKSHA